MERRCRGGVGLRSVRCAYASPVALVVAVLMLAGPVVASAGMHADSSSVDAPGLTAGPFITGAGLVWESSHGIVLTNSAGRSKVLAPPDAPNWDDFTDLAWFGRDWWALARPSVVLAGRIGGPLRELPLLHKCNPGSSTSSLASLRRSTPSRGTAICSAAEALPPRRTAFRRVGGRRPAVAPLARAHTNARHPRLHGRLREVPRARLLAQSAALDQRRAAVRSCPGRRDGHPGQPDHAAGEQRRHKPEQRVRHPG